MCGPLQFVCAKIRKENVMRKEFLEIGKIVGTHGVRGELRVEPWCDAPSFLTKRKTLYWDAAGTRPVRVRSARAHKTLVLLSLEGVDTVETADTLRGKILYVARGDIHLPEGRFFIQDLIGLSVFDADSGRRYGTLSDVFATGANDVYEIRDDAGKTYLFPAVADMLVRTDLDAGRMEIRPIRGIFDDED